jgi:hypothetical protein
MGTDSILKNIFAKDFMEWHGVAWRSTVGLGPIPVRERVRQSATIFGTTGDSRRASASRENDGESCVLPMKTSLCRTLSFGGARCLWTM